MIKFFRSIRQKLLAENKFSKYLIYALGEIALVMIGILLALQVNNWNEQNKTKEIEKALLLEYQEELHTNYDELTSKIEDYKFRANVCAKLLEAMEYKHPYADSLSRKFRILTVSLGYRLSHVVFNSIEDRGLDIISNKHLKKAIVHLHSNSYALLKLRIENQLANVKEYGRPIVRNQMKELDGLRYVPINYKELMSDVTVWNILMTLKGNYKNIVVVMEKTQLEITKLDEHITKELKR